MTTPRPSLGDIQTQRRTSLGFETRPLETRVSVAQRQVQALGERPAGAPPVRVTTRERILPGLDTSVQLERRPARFPIKTFEESISEQQTRDLTTQQRIQPLIDRIEEGVLAGGPFSPGVRRESVGGQIALGGTDILISGPIQAGAAAIRGIEIGGLALRGLVTGAGDRPAIIREVGVTAPREAAQITSRILTARDPITGELTTRGAASLAGLIILPLPKAISAATAARAIRPTPTAIPSVRVAPGFRARTQTVVIDPARPPTRAVSDVPLIEAGFDRSLAESSRELQATLAQPEPSPRVRITESGARLIDPIEATSLRRAAIEDVFDVPKDLPVLSEESLARLQRVTMREEALADPTQRTLQRLEVRGELIAEMKPAPGSIPLEPDISPFRALEFERSIFDFFPPERPRPRVITVDPTTGVTSELVLGEGPVNILDILSVVPQTTIPRTPTISRPPILERSFREAIIPRTERPVVTEPFRTTPLTISLEEATPTKLDSILRTEPDAVARIPRQPSTVKERTIPILESTQELIPVQDILPVQKPAIKARQRQRGKQKPKQEQAQEQAQDILPVLIQQPILDQPPPRTRRPPQTTVPDRPRRRQEEPRPRRIPPIIPLLELDIPTTTAPRFRVIVGQAGNKFFEDLGVGGIGLVRKARRFVETTPAATVRVAALNKEANIQQAARQFGKNFRLGKTPGTFVQRREARISSPGEVAGISLLGGRKKTTKEEKKKKKKKGRGLTNNKRLFNKAISLQNKGTSLRNIRDLLG